MSDPTARNRLDEEASPYLRQHADNPVDWQPWDDDALAAARERDVPIFLSVGYSACHWCHVMEEESFEDDAVAEVMNESFVPIKVDREERPDLDSVYQSVCQLVNGRGGWPLSVWLTPDGRPFYVGTYFPRDGRDGMPGFLEICRNIADSWADPDQRSDMEARADQWTDAVRDEVEASPAPPDGDRAAPDETVLDDATTAALRSADREHGGFGRSGPKFPHPGRVDLLLRAAERSGREEPLAVATETLDAMADGGLYDQLGGGFHRYCTDREWVVPHFEKMLYDNAELARCFLDAYRLTGRSRYALVGAETLAFAERELSHPDGGFYATLDADSGEGEGSFYVWTPAEVADAVDDETTAELFCERYGVESGGNFEGGTTVLTVTRSVPDLAEQYDLDETAVRERLMEARLALFDARGERERPPRDEKVLAGWNGLMVSAYAAGARTLDPAVADRGAEALSFVRDHLWDDERERLSRRFMDAPERGSGADGTPEASQRGDVKGRGYLEDYAFLARGAFDLYGATGEVDHLAFALELARVIRDEFYDADDGTIYSTPADGEELVARPQEPMDQSTPSSLGVATRLLLDLEGFAPDEGFGDAAADVLATHDRRVASSPLEHVSLAMAAAQRARGPLELTLAADETPDEWRETLARRYLPGAVYAPRPATESGLEAWLDRLGLAEAPPVWANRGAPAGEPTAYVCVDRTCSPPNRDLGAALEWATGGNAGDGPGEAGDDTPGN
ncbi:thioredoxin domain-containing protein [Candidatus Halobonum tyrrellensis]|uniref:Thioredoxin domain containing protein n=1 Tax=Candidatus Halobonum tyrrellensis G22 TaxID=1324957 RepID=V4HI83_9EURY|nr:thioredoxin domain-containing protein [Candidatus Halobonum tyrrellensis]ESP89473.1 thioredoxin domain containing protein [Candidatus Halobonum tyrrellensis G22]